MTEILSVRINKRLDMLIKMHISESHQEQADVVRDLIQKGGIFIAIQGYASGQYSTEKAASLAGLSIGEFIDLLLMLGVRSKLDVQDMLDASTYLEKIMH